MLCWVLASFCFSTIHLLKPPIAFTEPNEIGYWSSRGMVTSRKTSLKMVEDTANPFPFLCHRVPYNASTWEIEMYVFIKSGKMHFLFTDDFCQTRLSNVSITNWDGFHLILEREDRRIKVRMISSWEAIVDIVDTVLCRVVVEEDKPFRLHLQQSGRQVIVSHFDAFGSPQTCGTSPVRIENGFFTFMGEGDDSGSGDQDIQSFEVKPVSEVSKEFAEEQSNKRRRSLRATFDYLFKKRAAMMFSSRIDPKEVLEELDLSDMSPYNTALIFHVLSEIADRAKLVMNMEDLHEAIQMKVGVRLMDAEEKIAKRKRAIDALSDEVANFSDQIGGEINEIQDFVFDQLKEMVAQSQRHLDDLLASQNTTKKLSRFSKSATTQANHASVLLVVSLVEAVAFIAFFLVRRKQLRNFKID